MVEIPLGVRRNRKKNIAPGQVALVDDADYGIVKRYFWHARREKDAVNLTFTLQLM